MGSVSETLLSRMRAMGLGLDPTYENSYVSQRSITVRKSRITKLEKEETEKERRWA